jgi:hypothetical protein
VASPPTGGLLDESADLTFPADLHLVAPDEDRRRGREGSRLFPPAGVVVDDALLEVDTALGEVTPRLLAGGSVAQSVEDDRVHCFPTSQALENLSCHSNTGRPEPEAQCSQ